MLPHSTTGCNTAERVATQSTRAQRPQAISVVNVPLVLLCVVRVHVVCCWLLAVCHVAPQVVSVVNVSVLLAAEQHNHPHDAIFLPNGDMLVATWYPHCPLVSPYTARAASATIDFRL